MGNPNQIRQLIEERILAGQLPHGGAYEVFARKGDGLRCACCDEVITQQQIEHDVELCSDMGALATLPMHAFCYHLWWAASIQRDEQSAADQMAEPS